MTPQTTNTNHNLPLIPIENRILTIRGKQVMIDRDLAGLYGWRLKCLIKQ